MGGVFCSIGRDDVASEHPRWRRSTAMPCALLCQSTAGALFGGREMIGKAAFGILISTTLCSAAVADPVKLDDCNQYSAESQLEVRLACLQKNNDTLRDALNALDVDSLKNGGTITIRPGSAATNPDFCLWSLPGTVTGLGWCTHPGSAVTGTTFWRIQKK